MNIGVVEDDQIMGSSLIQRFELDGHKVDWWKTGSDAVNSLEFFEKDIIICDIRLPDITGETVLRQASRDGMAPPRVRLCRCADAGRHPETGDRER